MDTRHIGYVTEFLDHLDAHLAAFSNWVRSAFKALYHGIRYDRAWELVADPSCRAGRSQGSNADQEEETLNSIVDEALRVTSCDLRIHAELSLSELRPGIDLGAQAARLPTGRRIDRAIGYADEEIGVARNLLASHQFVPIANARRNLGQDQRVYVEDRLGVGLITSAWVVASQQQDVLDSHRCCRQ